MSAVGTCADNAAAESFFGMLKRERVNRRQYRTRAEARADVFDYIERFHNPRRARRTELAFFGSLDPVVAGGRIDGSHGRRRCDRHGKQPRYRQGLCSRAGSGRRHRLRDGPHRAGGLRSSARKHRIDGRGDRASRREGHPRRLRPRERRRRRAALRPGHAGAGSARRAGQQRIS